MTEDYDVLSMSESDDYTDTDASIDDADAAASDDSTKLNDADSSGDYTQQTLPSDDENGDGSGVEVSGVASVKSAPSATPSTGKASGSTPGSSESEFDPIASSGASSMYCLPRMPAVHIFDNQAAGDDVDRKDNVAKPGKDWGLSYLDTKKLTGKSPALVIAVFGVKEELALQVIHKLLSVMPKARFLWVRTTFEHGLLASEYIPSSNLFDHDPVLPTKRDIKKRASKLIDIFTYDTNRKGADKIGDLEAEPDKPQEVTGKLWKDCPAAPVIPVTTRFLGTNELNEKARILSSLDAPLLRSPDGIYTPLTIDYLDMLSPDMLMSMNSHGTVACMTTPRKATVPALWPASLMPTTFEELHERKFIQSVPTWLPVILKVTAMLLGAVLLYSKWSSARTTLPAPGAYDLKVWEPKSSSKSWFHRLFFVSSDSDAIDTKGVSTAVAKSGAALVAYINYLHLEFIRYITHVYQRMQVYGSHTRSLLNDALESKVARDAREYARAVTNDMDSTGKQLWKSMALDEKVSDVKTSLDKAGKFGQHASQKLLKLLSEARDSETTSNTLRYAKDTWSKYAQALRQ